MKLYRLKNKEVNWGDYGDILLTDSVKKKIEISDLKGFQFKPVIKQHISLVDWTTWNLEKEDPEFYPDNGEPENYILSLQHSQKLADQMENIWEVIAEVNETFTNSSTYKQGDKAIDIMRTENNGWFLVTEKAKLWIENNCDKWTEFWDLDDRAC